MYTSITFSMQLSIVVYSIICWNVSIIILTFDVTIACSCNGMVNTKCGLFKILEMFKNCNCECLMMCFILIGKIYGLFGWYWHELNEFAIIEREIEV